MMNLLTLIFYRVKVKDSQSGLRHFEQMLQVKLM